MSQVSVGQREMGRRGLALGRSLGAALRRQEMHPLDRAIGELRAELARTPDDPTLLGRLAALYYRRGDLPEAERVYRKAVALAPRRPSLYNNLGNVLCDMGRMREGIAMYETALEIERREDPSRGPSAEAVMNLEMAKLEYRLIHERIEYLERAAQLDVSSAEACNALGCGYLLRGQRTKALQAYRRAAELNPHNRHAALNIAFTFTLETDGVEDLQGAVAEIAEGIARCPGDGRLHIHWGELLETAGLFEEAEDRYLKAVQADNRCLEAYDLLGRLRNVQNSLHVRDEVARTVEKVLNRIEKQCKDRQENGESGAQICYDLAFVELARARFSRRPLLDAKAVDENLREAALRGRDLPQSDITCRAAILRAQLLEGEGRREEARVVLSNVPAEQENARLWFERGALLLRCGEIADALNAFDRATLCAPQEAVAYHSLRFALQGFRRWNTERVRFETAMRANARDAGAHHHFALALLSVRRDEQALHHFTQALKLDPRLADSACGQARALQRMGKLDEAEAALRKAQQIDVAHPDVPRLMSALRTQRLLQPGTPQR